MIIAGIMAVLGAGITTYVTVQIMSSRMDDLGKQFGVASVSIQAQQLAISDIKTSIAKYDTRIGLDERDIANLQASQVQGTTTMQKISDQLIRLDDKIENFLSSTPASTGRRVR